MSFGIYLDFSWNRAWVFLVKVCHLTTDLQDWCC